MPAGVALLLGNHMHLKPQMKKRSDFPNAMRCICRTPSTAWNLARTPALIHTCRGTKVCICHCKPADAPLSSQQHCEGLLICTVHGNEDGKVVGFCRRTQGS